MSISGVNNYFASQSLYDLLGTQSTDDDTSLLSLVCSSNSSSITQSDSLDLSKPAEIYSKLQSLAESDPEKLKELCAGIADELRGVSQNQTGSGAKMLSDLADKFQSVADGGDVSQLKPPDPPQVFGGSQDPVEAYLRQQDTQTAQTMGQTMDGLMSIILAQINKATAAQ